MQAELLIKDVSGDRFGSRILDSSDLRWTIGRQGDPESRPDIVFQSRLISRNHGQITFEAAGFWQYTHATTARDAHLLRSGQSQRIKCGDRIVLHDDDWLQLAGRDHSIYFKTIIDDTLSHQSNPGQSAVDQAQAQATATQDKDSNLWSFAEALAESLEQASGYKLILMLLIIWSGIVLAIAIKQVLDAL